VRTMAIVILITDSNSRGSSIVNLLPTESSSIFGGSRLNLFSSAMV